MSRSGAAGAPWETPAGALQETVEDLRPDSRRRTLSGTSVSVTEVVLSQPTQSAPQATSDFGIAAVEEKVEVLNAGVRRTTRKSTVTSMHSLQAIREVPENSPASNSGDFGITLSSAEQTMRELQQLEQQVEVVARKEKENRLASIRYDVQAKGSTEPRRSSAPALLRAVTDARQTEGARKRERARTTIRHADANGGTINFAELAALAAVEDDTDDDEDDEDDDEAEKAKMEAARNARTRQHTVNHSGAAVATRDFEARRRFQTIGGNSLKPRGSISGPMNPFVSALNGGRRYTTYNTNKTSRELSEILKLVPLQKVKVVESLQEWDDDDDEKENASPEQLYEHAQGKSQAREKRLTFACMNLEQEQPLGDAEVEVVTAKKEWDDSDEEVNDKQFEESIIDKRETRRTLAMAEIMKDQVVADAEVEVVAEVVEWADADSDEDVNDKQFEEIVVNKRETRRTLAQVELMKDQVVPDVEVEVMEENQEWSGGVDLDDEDDHIPREKAAASAFQAREKRLTVAFDELQKELQLADAELAVTTEEKEWAADPDSDEDVDEKAAENQRERRNTANFSAREKRLTIAVEEMQKELIVADTELEVQTEFKEWDAGAESDEDVENVLDKRNTQAFEQREKRLTLAAGMLENEVMIGDAEMVVNKEAKEWADGGDSDEDIEGFDKLAKRASVSFSAREQRITMALMKLDQEGWVGNNEVMEKRLNEDDGIAYSRQEFLDYFGDEEGARRWDRSVQAGSVNGHS